MAADRLAVVDLVELECELLDRESPWELSRLACYAIHFHLHLRTLGEGRFATVCPSQTADPAQQGSLIR